MDEERRVKLPWKSTTVVNPTFRKVQVVYYISNNGQLEHPHIVEVSHLVHHQLRLKDVLDRLGVLRGRGMPYLYSWSCKRMYKNGYVWNDLGENDVVFPSEGHEYVLKASQLVLSSPDKQAPVEIESQTGAPKHKQMTPKRHIQFNEEELELEDKRINDTNTARGVRSLIISTKTAFSPATSNSGESKRFEDGDPYPTLVSRNSALLHIMACGGFKGKRDNDTAAGRKSSSSSGSWRVQCKKVEDEEEICCMSENPRFGKVGADERQYFSGSIVETMSDHTRLQVEPIFNKSSSYKEERGSKTSIGAGEVDDDAMKREKTVAGNCIPKRFC